MRGRQGVSSQEVSLWAETNSKSLNNDILIVSLYVDDLLLMGNMHEIKQAEHEVSIYQKKYAKEILKKFKLEECKEVSTPMNQKEKLCKEDEADKVDEGYFRSLIGLPRDRYIKGTSNFGVKFTRNKKFKLVGFFDSDWGGSIDDMKSTLGYCFTFGFGVFSWSSKKQETVTQSIVEVEFIVAAAAVNQALCLCRRNSGAVRRRRPPRTVVRAPKMLMAVEQVADVTSEVVPGLGARGG
ncbi:hypothetical protein CXB51_001086 [Gossypium anomalum]|uniref:Reverse transcriptase Ty1/copia-type domain-containing protein n=1 Tax=Gossypium anomalum TaxID=47600 RepID=A0A8J5Z4P4_9ROSI|nr:hypothetical protein CXB51_001086 [Gossypium anomalum]